MDDQEDIGTLTETSGPFEKSLRTDIIYSKYCNNLERLYESCIMLLLWGLNPFQGLAPGRAAKIRLEPRRRHFFENFDHFRLSCPDLSRKRDFSKTHKWTQGSHSWIGLDLLEVGKLLRSQTNSRIARYLHFCHQFFPLGARGEPSTIIHRAG